MSRGHTTTTWARDVREAVLSGNVEHVQEAIVHVLDIFDKAATLSLAVKVNDRPCAQALLDAGCDPCLRLVEIR